MATRIASAVVVGALFLALTFVGGWWFVSTVTLLAVFGLREWAGAYRSCSGVSGGWQKMNTATTALGTCFPVFAHYVALSFRWMLPIYAAQLTIFVLLFCCGVWRFSKTKRGLGNWKKAWGLVGCIYVGVLFSSFVLVRELSGRGAWLLLMVAVCVWATDSLAYFMGRAFGRRKLAPALSPNKTVEGSLGGLAGALIAGGIFAMSVGFPLWHGLALGAMAGTMGQLGDLWESALKREVGIKDFGAIMPGHGGVLDRFDSLLFVMPLAYTFLLLTGGK